MRPSSSVLRRPEQRPERRSAYKSGHVNRLPNTLVRTAPTGEASDDHRRSSARPGGGPFPLWSLPGDPAGLLDARQHSSFVDRALEVFGVNRLMYGGDWPISVAAGGYDRVFRGLGEVLAGLSEGERQEIYAGTAARFYGSTERWRPARSARAAQGDPDERVHQG